MTTTMADLAKLSLRRASVAAVLLASVGTPAIAQSAPGNQSGGKSSSRSSDRQTALKARAIAASQNYLDIIQRHSTEFGVDANLVMAVLTVESDGNPNSVSSAGAMGLMQLMPGTCSDLGVADPYDPDENIRGGVALLARHARRYKGDLQKVLAAYNAGPRHADDGSWMLISETRRYVPTVLAYYAALKGSLNDLPTFQDSPPVAILPPDPATLNLPPPRYLDMMFSGIQTSQNVADPGGLAENGTFDQIASGILSDFLDGKVSQKTLQMATAKYLARTHKKAKTLKAFLMTSVSPTDFTTEWDKLPMNSGNAVGLAHSLGGPGHVWVVIIGSL
jgi:hypothetical protein